MPMPLSIYRIQFTPSFGFAQAAEIIEYLYDLGITDIYASPIFKATPDSQHGYDIIDPNELNPQLGSEDEFANLTAAVNKNSMGWLQDIVPNHVAFSMENKLLLDVLEKGKESKYSEFFDIRWQYTFERLEGKIFVPFLGKPYRKALEDGELKIESQDGRYWLTYFEKKFPIRKQSYQKISKQKNFDAKFLDEIVSGQFYKPIFWQETNEKINYRRFFYLNDFIALNQDSKKVFDYWHQLIFELVKKGIFTGLRIDHIDGLADPAAYLKKLRENIDDKYIIVEKILELDEKIHPDWPIQGTTGYDFLNYVNAVFCKSQNSKLFDQLYCEIAIQESSYNDLLYNNKKLIIEKYLPGDIDYLVFLLNKIYPGPNELRFKQTLTQILSNFEVYRTYITETDHLTSLDYLEKALAGVNGYKSECDAIAKIFSGKVKGDWSSKFISQFQQISSVVMAKGFEDTFLYNYNRLLSLNEVGSKPSQFGISLDKFHRFNQYRAQNLPLALSASSTHDTKRSEDIRARLNVLSEIPESWTKKVKIWMELNSDKKTMVHGSYAPDKNEEYHLYQTLIGAFPFHQDQQNPFIQRVKQYFIKALRESKKHTTWADPNKDYENACMNFIEKIMESSQFLQDFKSLQKKIAYFGMFNSLSQTLIKITSPGVPDFYQGSELWNLSLVDPDNRRPVDYQLRKQFLSDIREKFADSPNKLITELLNTKTNGRIKLFLIWKAMQARDENKTLFQKGAYKPLQVEGKYKENVIAFARSYESEYMVTIAPRFLTQVISENQLPIGKQWEDTHITSDFDPAHWINCISDQKLQAQKKIYMSDALSDFPVSLLKTTQ